MYNTHFVCTYKMHDSSDEEIQDMIYKYDYLSAFNLKEYDSEIIMNTLENIYETLKYNKDFKEILEAHPRFVKEKNNYEFVMQFMFSFDTFDLFHNCLIYLLYNTRLKKMKNSIDNLMINSIDNLMINVDTKKPTNTTSHMNHMNPSEIVSDVSKYSIPDNLYSYFTFENNKNKLIQQLKTD